MSQSFDWNNSVLQVLIENYRTSVKNKVQQFSDSYVRHTKILFPLNRIAFILCLLLLYIEYTMYAYMFHKNQCLRRDIKLIVKYRVIWITSVVIVYLLRTLTRDVKVVQPYFIVFIKHGSFPSLCIGDNHRNVLEWYIYTSKVCIRIFRLL